MFQLGSFLWDRVLLVGVAALCTHRHRFPNASRLRSASDIPVLLLGLESFFATAYPDSIKTGREVLIVIIVLLAVWALVAVDFREKKAEIHSKAPARSVCNRLRSKLRRLRNDLDAYEVNVRLEQPYDDEFSSEAARSEADIAALIGARRGKTNELYLDTIFDEIVGLLPLIEPFKVRSPELSLALELSPVSPEDYLVILKALDTVYARLGT